MLLWLFSLVQDLWIGFSLAEDGYEVIGIMENPFMEVVKDAFQHA